MLDIIIIICCIMAGFAIGKFLERKVNEKGKFYQDLIVYIALLKDNISSKQLELGKFNQEYTLKCSKTFADFITNKELKIRLSKMQRDNINALFDNLDCVSTRALEEHLEFNGSILGNDCNNVMQNEVAKSAMFSKLGMLLGAMLGILLV